MAIYRLQVGCHPQPRRRICRQIASLSQILFNNRGHNKSLSMGGDHGPSKPELPDWRQWKVEGTPLEFTQQRLAARGLKDPWARNEAWRFQGGFAHSVTFSEVLFRGFKWGFAAFAVALAVEYAFFPPKKSDH